MIRAQTGSFCSFSVLSKTIKVLSAKRDYAFPHLLGKSYQAFFGIYTKQFTVSDAVHRELSVVRAALRSAEGFVQKRSARNQNRKKVLEYMRLHAGKPVRVVDLKRNASAWNDLMHSIKDAQLEGVKRIVPAIISPKNLTDWEKDPKTKAKATVLEFAQLCITNQLEIVNFLKSLLKELRVDDEVDDEVDDATADVTAAVAALDVAAGGGGGFGGCAQGARILRDAHCVCSSGRAHENN